MVIKLYNMITDKIRVNKSAYLNNELTLEGTLREECALNTPSILIDSRTFQNSISLFSYNYAYIVDFNRYYFIGEIVSENTYLWRISLVEDTLYTYKDKIYDLEAYVLRNENTYDVLQQDVIPLKSGYDVEVFEPNMTSGVSLTSFDPSDVYSYNYGANIVVCISENITKDESYEPPEYRNDFVRSPYSLFSTIWSSNTSSGNAVTPYLVNFQNLVPILNTVRGNDTLASYIVSLVSFPFRLYGGDSTPSKSIAINGSVTGAVGYKGYEDFGSLSPYIILADFTYTSSGKFTDYDPYTKYSIYLPYAQWVDISAEDLLNQRLAVVYVVDYENGSAIVELINVNKNYVIFSSSCQLGTVLSLNTTNALENENTRNAIAQRTELTSMSNSLSKSQATTNAAISLAGSTLSTGTAIATGEYGDAASGATKIASSISNMVYAEKTYELAEESNMVNAQIQYSQVYDTANCSVSSGNFGLYGPQKVYIKKVKQRLVYDPDSESFRKFQGRVLNKFVKLSTLSGFTTISAVHLNNFGGATLTELNTLDSLLKAGIIL